MKRQRTNLADSDIAGAEWQSHAVEARHPGMATAIMPIGPEFASPDTFFPPGLETVYDVVYVAAAQPYKRHDIFFDALARLPRSIRALCVCGYEAEKTPSRQIREG